MQDKLKISISIAGRSYPVYVRDDKEASQINKIVKRINEAYGASTKKYDKLDAQDHLALLCLQFANTEGHLGDDHIEQALERISQKIDSHLNSATSILLD